MRRRGSPEDQLARLADGTLDDAARAALERDVAVSPELAAKLSEQERAIALTRAIDLQAPASLLERVASSRERPLRARRRLSGRGAIALGAVVVVLALLAARGHGPDVRGVVRFSLAAATLPTPTQDRADAGELDAAVAGIAFPDWTRLGWLASGARSDTLQGHAVATVFYTSPEYARLGYSIVGGSPLAVGAANQTVVHDGVSYSVVSTDGATVVTWRREDHTCVLASRVAPAAVLLRLAGSA